VAGFQHRADAERLLKEFQERLAKFELEVHPETARLTAFGREAWRNRKRGGQSEARNVHVSGVYALLRRELEWLLSGLAGNGGQADEGQAPTEQAGTARSDARAGRSHREVAEVGGIGLLPRSRREASAFIICHPLALPGSSRFRGSGVSRQVGRPGQFHIFRRPSPSALTSASTEPRMSKSGPLRTATAGRSLTFAALCSRRESADCRGCETGLASSLQCHFHPQRRAIAREALDRQAADSRLPHSRSWSAHARPRRMSFRSLLVSTEAFSV
jgi:hypothetical protein